MQFGKTYLMRHTGFSGNEPPQRYYIFCDSIKEYDGERLYYYHVTKALDNPQILSGVMNDHHLQLWQIAGPIVESDLPCDGCGIFCRQTCQRKKK